MARRRNTTAGFTLVEIMVVLAILVLLVALVGPRVLKTQDKADLKITQTQISNLEQALDFYKNDVRSYPTTEEGLGSLMKKPAEEGRGNNWAGPYLDEDALPADPWGNAFRYEFPPTRGASTDKPNIWSAGPDGQDETEDDIVNWKKEAAEGGDAAGGTEAATADGGANAQP
jgi:general secretion pathway protein G